MNINDQSSSICWFDGIARDEYGRPYETVTLEAPNGQVTTQEIPPGVQHNPYRITNSVGIAPVVQMIPVVFAPVPPGLVPFTSFQQPVPGQGLQGLTNDSVPSSNLKKRRFKENEKNNPPSKVTNHEKLCRNVWADMNKLFLGGDVNKLRIIFQQAVKQNLVNTQIFQTYMQLENELEGGDINLVRDAFNQAKALIPLTGSLIKIYMENEQKQGDIDKIEEVFQFSIEQKLLNEEILKTFIFCQSRLSVCQTHLSDRCIQNVRRAFHLAWDSEPEKGLFSTDLFKTYITAEEKMKGSFCFEKVKGFWRKGFQKERKALQNKIYDSTLFLTYMHFAKKKKDITAVRAAFNKAVELKCYSNDLFLVAMQSERELGKAQNTSMLRRIFKNAIESNCPLNTTFFCNYMAIEGEIRRVTGHIHNALEHIQNAFNIAVERNLFDTKIIATFIHCNSCMPHLDKEAMLVIRQAFKLALENNLDLYDANLAVVYIEIENRYIGNKYGDSQSLELIQEAFEAAISTNCSSVELFNRYIVIMAKHGQFQKAKEAFFVAMQIPNMEFTDEFFLDYNRTVIERTP